MTDEQISQAISYNRRQGFSTEEVEFIQRTVGSEADGLWGSLTVKAIWRWQKDHDIPPDGKVWRNDAGNTWPRIKQAGAEEEHGIFRVGLWIDDPPSRVLEAGFADALQEIGATSAAIMVNASNTRTSDPPWKPLWSSGQLVRAAELLRQRNIELILTAWPRPSASQIGEMRPALAELLDATGAEALELDAEGNWRSRFLEGFASMQEAGQALAGELRALLPPGGRLELTTYPFHSEFTSSAALSPHMDVLLPQAYSVFRADDDATHWGEQLAPGNMQRLAIERARSVSGPAVACGLAAYFQDRYPGHSAQDSMSSALQAVSADGVSEIRYWSSKWTIGHMKNAYAEAFLRGIPKADA
ncbi:MAG TPA: peptidoglycan-binding domain-containing protein [Acidobacteriota bacterium]|nr:peptidoglycan-binding domain-containing protein [Acidobacteriota bacterium]